MDLKNLTTFLYAAELGSFTRTAEMLRYSQSTVSFQIKQLENELGTPLFERVGHAVFLTERGREVLRYAHAVTRLTQELQNSMASRPLLAGHMVVLKVVLDDQGQATAVSSEVGVSVTLDWKPGGDHDVEI